jgi:hypothetical protein
MVHLKTHPDYMNFGDTKPGLEEYPVEFYVKFLEYVKSRYEGQYWHVLPKELADFWPTAGAKAPSVRCKAPPVLCSCCQRLVEQNCISFFPPT